MLLLKRRTGTRSDPLLMGALVAARDIGRRVRLYWLPVDGFGEFVVGWLGDGG